MSKIKIGDEVRCIRAVGTSGALTLEAIYTVTDVSPNYRHVRLHGVSGSFMVTRFAPVARKTGKPANTFGQVRAVTVNKSDIHDVLTQYVRFGLGIDASVEKIVEKFPDAIELVLSSEAAA
ncbi:hypothetical protein Lo5R7ANS_21 [Mesorhizobium phage vB_MloP_Lo5R7ANS]|uniref:Uncharacterized protein n=1 Tax=Mesorhizobium phage vB_MloP_Lo5R7ANS TaxID=1527771 RepID=A0A076YQI2_9CAUD|nr:hypothetical protein Lo5R7ANS_21 [Mesorhizobium phage vB_MloP_Lo5R7ANS]AIK68491.1 hypothetical protein Lo5R7ANS_21 [Mesorhizobium phage vB_MloP_Lo5R7ANS]